MTFGKLSVNSIDMNRFVLKPIAFTVFAFIAFLSVSATLHAANIEVQNYKRAFALVEAGHADQAVIFALKGRDPVLNKALRAYYMEQPGNSASFSEITGFMAHNPEWPGQRALGMAAEQKIPADATPAQVIQWFTEHPPITPIGVYRYVDALQAEGRVQEASNLITDHWVEGEFSGEEQYAFLARFSRTLDVDAHWSRLDHLLWKGDAAAARRMYPYVDDEHKMVAEARLALASQKRNAESFAMSVPINVQNDPGLQYELLRYAVRNEQDDQAVNMLKGAPDIYGNPDMWWEQRQIMIRRMMDRRDYASAYRLAVEHGRIAGKKRLEAEFMAGWLALRFLDAPSEARNHFQSLADDAQTPISRARGYYWLGRAYEALNDTESARDAYEIAAALNITFYGQLAATRIYQNPIIHAAAEPAVPQKVRTVFFDRDEIRIIERLHAIGMKDQARTFFRAAADHANTRADFVLLSELAYRIERPDLAIETAKAANQKNIVMSAGGFPLLNSSLPKQPEPAFTHAVIRQESMFNPEAESSAGARGLMQLMPTTARGMAKKLNIKFSPQSLSNSSFSLRIGAAFIQNQIDTFDGSYVLALAGYNAGPHRVREWMQQIGDPRSSNIDIIDWIEEIPVAETRNYVQRILENLQVYRARLKGGQAPLLILKDLAR